MKSIVWMGGSRTDLAAFPPQARRQAGHQLQKVQRGEEPSDWKPMSTVGPGAREIRIREQCGIFRVVYVATQPEAVYVLHCFQKKAQKTRRTELDLARARFSAVRKHRKIET